MKKLSYKSLMVFLLTLTTVLSAQSADDFLVRLEKNVKLSQKSKPQYVKFKKDIDALALNKEHSGFVAKHEALQAMQILDKAALTNAGTRAAYDSLIKGVPQNINNRVYLKLMSQLENAPLLTYYSAMGSLINSKSFLIKVERDDVKHIFLRKSTELLDHGTMGMTLSITATLMHIAEENGYFKFSSAQKEKLKAIEDGLKQAQEEIKTALAGKSYDVNDSEKVEATLKTMSDSEVDNVIKAANIEMRESNKFRLDLLKLIKELK